MIKYILLIVFVFINLSCQTEITPLQSDVSSFELGRRPNILFILLDDFGYELPTCDGGQSYQTPNIDSLASVSVRCTNFRVCPNCSPSRVSMLTGKYSFRNYDQWGVMKWENVTLANRLQDNGYATAVFGKWQLDGGDAAIRHFGFETYDVDNPYELNSDETFGSRYKNPVMYKNGENISYTNNEYLDDIITDDAVNFMDTVSKSFFLYLSLSNTHYPFQPPPTHPQYLTFDTAKSDKTLFPSMISYVDMLIGKVLHNITENTIVILCGDNGTPPLIYSIYNGDSVHGDKGETNEFGIHVPLIIYGRGVGVNNNFIDAPDIFTTVLDFANIPKQKGDGVSIFSDNIREYSYCYWSPKSSPTSTKIAEWVLGKEYKVYADGTMYYTTDKYEEDKIHLSAITPEQQKIKDEYLSIIKSKH